MTFELTFAIIKPHAVRNTFALRHIKQILLENDFQIVRYKQFQLTSELAERFYGEHQKKFFYTRLVSFMTSGPCEAYILARENAIGKWRELIGPTKVFKTIHTHPESIRGVFGLSDTRNACHGSDSIQSMKAEANVFFPDFKLQDWAERELDSFVNGDTKLDLSTFTHVKT